MIPATTGHVQGVDTRVTIGAGILEECLGALLCNPRHLYETRQKISVAVLCVSDTTPVELWDRTVFRILCLGDVTRLTQVTFCLEINSFKIWKSGHECFIPAVGDMCCLSVVAL